jgi:hypothetical protein
VLFILLRATRREAYKFTNLIEIALIPSEARAIK